MNSNIKNSETLLSMAIDELGLELIEYSGKGMYGKKCIGVVSDMTALAIFETLVTKLVELSEDGGTIPSEVIKNIGPASEDSMGMGTVLYFPELIQ